MLLAVSTFDLRPGWISNIKQLCRLIYWSLLSPGWQSGSQWLVEQELPNQGE